jgi:transposase
MPARAWNWSARHWRTGSAARAPCCSRWFEALAKETLKAGKLHTDDTPVPVLAPGRGTTRTGRLWMDAHDDRPAGDGCPPSVLFRYSSDRKGERPQDHLRTFRGFLQADGYAGYNRLYGNEIVEVACWAHVRRKFHDVYVRRCARLVLAPGSRGYDNGSTRPCAGSRADPISPPPSATPARAGISSAAIATMAAWRSTTALPSGRYGVWRSGRKNWLFAGSDAGGQRAAAIYSLVETCTLNAVNPKPTCATCSASSQIIPSIASPSSYLGTLVTSLPGPKNSGPPADAYGSTGAQVVSTP